MSAGWAPNPPNFYKQFTAANLSRIEDFKKEDAGGASNFLALPPELRYLIAPEPPVDGDYKLFGVDRTIRDFLRPLPEQGIEQVYPNSPSDAPDSNMSKDWTISRQTHLTKIARSIILSFMELSGRMSELPDSASLKTKQLEVLFLNAHHLINEYRPHQARESLILRMEDEIERGRKEVEDVKRLGEKIEAVLGGTDVVMEEVNGDSNGVNRVTEERAGVEKDLANQKSIWEVWDKELAA